MFKVKVIALAFAASFAVSALASTSAMATCGGGADTTEEWCVGNAVLTQTVELSETAEAAKGELEVPLLGVHFECTTLNGREVRIQPGTINATMTSLTFGRCVNIETPNCKLKTSSITTKAINVTEVKEVGEKEVTSKFKPVAGSFANIELEGASCAATGIQAVTGSATITGPTGQEQKEKQEIKANTGAGELKVAGDEAKLKGSAVIKLKSKSVFGWD